MTKFTRNIIKLFICELSDHKWEWKYLADDSCEQWRVCSRCDTDAEIATRIIHQQWGEWEYLTEDSCEQQRVCDRCQDKETRIIHQQWGEWEYLTEGYCEQQRVCDRCKDKETREIHQWKEGEWKYLDNTSCEQQLVCVRCKREETHTERHEWWNQEDVTDDDDRWKGDRVYEWECTRCGCTKTETRRKRDYNIDPNLYPLSWPP